MNFKHLTGFPQIKVNNTLGELAGKTLNIQESDDSTETIRDCYFHVDSSLRQTKPFKSSAVYFSRGLPLKIHSPPPEMHRR